MSKRKRRGTHIFGMTGAQLGVLAVLSLVAIGIIYGGFIYLGSSTQPGGAANSPASAPGLPHESGTASVLDEITSLSLTATLDPSAIQIPPDWKQYNNARIELRVPPQFNAVNYEIERQKRIDFLRGQGSVPLVARLEGDIFEPRFWFNFPQPDTVTFVTSISVEAEFLPTETLAEYVDGAYGENLQGLEVINRQEYPIEGLIAERLLMVANLNDLSLAVAEYVVTDEINLWIISCWSDFDEFYTWLPEFDRVARSFRLVQ